MALEGLPLQTSSAAWYPRCRPQTARGSDPRSTGCMPANLYWWDASGEVHEMRQDEGVAQSDPLAPTLDVLGQQDALPG